MSAISWPSAFCLDRPLDLSAIIVSDNFRIFARPRMGTVDSLQNLSARPLRRDLDIPKALHPWHRLGMETSEMSAIKTETVLTLLGSDYLPQETLARELGV